MSIKTLQFVHICVFCASHHVSVRHCSLVRSITRGVTVRELLTLTTGLALQQIKHLKWIGTWLYSLSLCVCDVTLLVNKDRVRERSHGQIRVLIVVHVQVARERISEQRNCFRSWREHLKNTRTSWEDLLTSTYLHLHNWTEDLFRPSHKLTCAAFLWMPFGEPQ